MALQESLRETLNSLHRLGTEAPDVLVYLSQIVQPHLPDDQRITILTSMFSSDIQGIINGSTQDDLYRIVSNPPHDAVPLRLLLDLRALAGLLIQLSPLQLIHLTNTPLPEGTIETQVAYVSKLKELFSTWTTATLEIFRSEIVRCRINTETEKMLSLVPDLPWSHLYSVIELLKLPANDLQLFHQWISALTDHQIQQFTELLLLDGSTLFFVHQKFYPTPLVEEIASLDFGELQCVEEPEPATAPILSLPPPMSSFTLTIARQPPLKTVYQRILKPQPSISLVVDGNENMNNLFVEASLIKSDQDVEIPSILDGNKIIRIQNGQFATFKKLKILSTSQQQGTLFRLKFTLLRYLDNGYVPVPNSVIYSNPIEVFSHTIYLNERSDSSAPPPAVSEVIPSVGKVGSRVVILGSGFLNNPNLRVKFGDVVIQPNFHETGTLIATVPAAQLGVELAVTVANDGVHYSDANSKACSFWIS